MKKFGVLIIFAITIILSMAFMKLLQFTHIDSIYRLISIVIFAFTNMFLGIWLVANVSKLSRESKVKKFFSDQKIN